jgi:DNA-directed RNA polymerase specialized sigma24 family protein
MSKAGGFTVVTRENAAGSPSRRFPTTSWTIVSAAGRHSSGSAEALNQLCASYWFPVYAFIRKRGYAREAAEDLSQEFFARILEHGALSGARRERGKFRSFLLASVTNFLANEWDRSQAQKRGGGCPALSLDFQAGETRYHIEPCHELTPEALFERQWALAVLDLVLARLREEFSRKGQAAQFDRLQVFLTGDQDHGSYDRAARDLNLSDGAARTAVHRLRRQYAELVREEIQLIVGDPDEVEGEIRFLLAALGQA